MIDDEVSRIARRQDGIITRAQAIDKGMSEAAIRHALRRDGRWQRVLPGIYATFDGPLADLHRLRAALLHGGEDAMITGAWACSMNGLKYGPETGENVEILVPRTTARRTVQYVHVIHSNRRPSPVYWIDEDAAKAGGVARPLAETSEDRSTAIPGELAMVPAARSVVDTVTRPAFLPVGWSPVCSDPDGCPLCWGGRSHGRDALQNVRALMCELVQRRRGTLDDLTAEVDAARRRGTALARTALADIVAGCRSAPECELRDVVRSSRILPEPRWNQVLPGRRGIYPDACWPEAGLVVEVDSRSWHGFGDAPERTERRRAVYAEHGWTVLPVSPARLRSDPRGVLRQIETAYLAGRDRRR